MDTLKLKHQKAITLFENNQTTKEVAKALQLPMTKIKYWYKGFKKLRKHNLKERFKLDFASGKITVEELSKRYNTDRKVLLNWKHELYGKGSLKQKRMYQMYLVEIPTKVIAEFYNAHPFSVNRAIRKQKAIVNTSK